MSAAALAWARDERVTYFASGSNRTGEIRGLDRAGLHLGICALEVTRKAVQRWGALDMPRLVDAVRELLGTEHSRIFVDSGAFSEVRFGAQGPEVVRPMGRAEWSKVFGLYAALAGSMGLRDRLYLVAPDRVGCQATTLDRLREWGFDLRTLALNGASILIPVQKGGRGMADFYRAELEAVLDGDTSPLVVDQMLPAIPMKKDATSVEELRAFVREVQPRRIHLLGIGPRSRRFEAALAAVVEEAPGCEVLCDSVALRSLVGRSNGAGGGPRALTAAMDEIQAAAPELDAQEARARAIVSIAGEPEPELEPEPACPHCGAEWLLGDDLTIYGCDVFVDEDGGDQWLSWRPCCEAQRDAVVDLGFDAAYGVSLEEAVALIEPALEVLEILGDGDGSIVARLHVVDPAADAGPDGKGHRRASSPSGWRDQVFADVDEHHSHHGAPVGHKYSVAVYNGRARVGVAVVGRPVSRVLAQAEPDALEVTRVCVWGNRALRRNAASKLYAAAARKARALGYAKLITYTLASESGHSLRASGWTPVARSRGGTWDRPGRAREDSAPTEPKIRWEKGLTKRTRKAIVAAA